MCGITNTSNTSNGIGKSLGRRLNHWPTRSSSTARARGIREVLVRLAAPRLRRLEDEERRRALRRAARRLQGARASESGVGTPGSAAAWRSAPARSTTRARSGVRMLEVVERVDQRRVADEPGGNVVVAAVGGVLVRRVPRRGAAEGGRRRRRRGQRLDAAEVALVAGDDHRRDATDVHPGPPRRSRRATSRRLRCGLLAIWQQAMC